ncbi:MAG: hypothetical protein NTY06_02490 [Candidatus Gottesmanbacteria bacterium]|nr:hypothetical protein [Candidatus Gottesmanbacteria bacterium]
MESNHMETPVVEPIDPIKKGDAPMKTQSARIIIGVYAVLVLLGIGTGYLLSHSNITGVGVKSGIVKTDKVSGSTDTTTFKDSAIGVIEKNGTDGEGTHQLIRDGGPSQTVTLMSSVVDLDQYVGKKVKVYGQTLDAQTAAWLMDVGRVELQ